MTSTKFIRRFGKNLPHLFRREPCFLLNEIFLTYHCTQRCLQCIIPQKAESMAAMSFEHFKTIIDRLDEFGAHGIIISGGEPLLHPQLFECLDYVAEKIFSYVHILSTLYASRPKVEQLVEAILRHKIAITCSFDGFDETVDYLRGARNVSQTLMENIAYLDEENTKLGRPIKTGINIVVSQKNLRQIPEILSYIERIRWLASVDVYRHYPNRPPEADKLRITDFAELQRVIERAKQSPAVITPAWLLDGFTRYFENHMPKQCPYLDSPSLGSRFFIQPNGDVKTCFETPIGNLLMQTPEEILASPARRAKQQEFAGCAGCWNACHTPFSKASQYTFAESVRTYRVLKEYKKNLE